MMTPAERFDVCLKRVQTPSRLPHNWLFGAITQFRPTVDWIFSARTRENSLKTLFAVNFLSSLSKICEARRKINRK
jgi:hypothetical protein